MTHYLYPKFVPKISWDTPCNTIVNAKSCIMFRINKWQLCLEASIVSGISIKCGEKLIANSTSARICYNLCICFHFILLETPWGRYYNHLHLQMRKLRHRCCQVDVSCSTSKMKGRTLYPVPLASFTLSLCTLPLFHPLTVYAPSETCHCLCVQHVARKRELCFWDELSWRII